MPPKQSKFQFSLRTLFVVLLVLPAGVGVFLQARWKSQKQWAVVDQFLGMGTEFRSRTDVVDWANEIPIPQRAPWWQRLLGVDCPQELTVYFEGSPEAGSPPVALLSQLPQLEDIRLVDGKHTSDDDLAALDKLPKLRALHIYSDQLTDAGVAHLAKNSSIQRLTLEGTRLTDDALASAASMPNLRFLELTKCAVTDSGLAHIRNKQSLVGLALRVDIMGDEWLGHLSTCENLESLLIRKCKLTAEGMNALSKLKKLKSLQLYQSAFAGEGLHCLLNLQQLEKLEMDMSSLQDKDLSIFHSLPLLLVLDLSNSQVTDAGLLSLASHKSLREIHIRNTQITAEGAAEFIKRAPRVHLIGS